MSCGGGLCNVCCSYMSVPVLASASERRQFIDASAASATRDLIIACADGGGSFHFNGYFADEDAAGAQRVLRRHDSGAGRRDEGTVSRVAKPAKVDRPVPLVLSGGSTMPKGFRDRFEKAILASDFPVAVSSVTVAKNPLDDSEGRADRGNHRLGRQDPPRYNR